MNKVILMGRLTRDPEVRYTQTNNTLVSSFSLAVNRRFARQGEERQADFINIVAWSKLGEFCSKYFKKGQQVGVIGRIQTRTWDDDQGTKHYVTEVVAEEAYFADSKKDGDNANNQTFENTFGNTAPGNIQGPHRLQSSLSSSYSFSPSVIVPSGEHSLLYPPRSVKTDPVLHNKGAYFSAASIRTFPDVVPISTRPLPSPHT